MQYKIAIIHPKLGWGGSEATVLWMIEALKNDYNISLITSKKVDILALNKYYGTNLKPEDFSLIQVPMPLGLANTAKFAALRGRFMQRYCQKISSQFDIMIDAYSPCDFKTRGIQFATDIQNLTEIITLSSFKKWWYGNTLLRNIYLNICDWVSPLNQEAWKNNITLSNSHWTAKLIKEKYDLDSSVLYPPVAGSTSLIPYEKRSKGFVCLGRIIPEKKIDMAIEIIKRVRQMGHDVKFHIIGGIGDEKYANVLKNICFENKDWLFFEGRLSREAQNTLIANQQFGISCRKNEPFGIAVAEMVKAGCIVFVPDGGGQTEIVDNEALIYEDINDAVKKIENIIINEDLQNNLSQHLSLMSQKFSVEKFKEEIKNIVKNFDAIKRIK